MSDPIVAAIYLAVAVGLFACVYQAARIVRWHVLFCDRCRVRRAIRANRRPPSSRAVESHPRFSGPAPSPVDAAAPPRRHPPAPNPGGRRPVAPAHADRQARAVRHG